MHEPNRAAGHVRRIGGGQAQVVRRVGAKCGLKEGDFIFKFDGRLLPTDDPLARLKAWMQEVPYGKTVKLVVKRNGEDVELTLKWDAPKKE